MPVCLRCSRLRLFIKEIKESPRFEKLSFIPPFLILIVEITLFIHAVEIQVLYVIQLTIILVALSIVEIFFVISEIHEHYRQNNFERILTIKLDDFILKSKYKNVQFLVNHFLKENPEYASYRNHIYHISCQILETHKEEIYKKNLEKDLKRYIKSTSHESVDAILSNFLKKYPEYKTSPSKIYKRICEYLNTEK